MPIFIRIAGLLTFPPTHLPFGVWFKSLLIAILNWIFDIVLEDPRILGIKILDMDVSTLVEHHSRHVRRILDRKSWKLEAVV